MIKEKVMNYLSMKKVSTVAGIVFLLTGCSMNTDAFGIPGFGGGDSSSSVDTGTLVETSETLVKHYKVSMISIQYAQAEALEAFGLGDEAEVARQDAKTYSSGVVDGDEGDQIIANTNERDDLIREAVSEGVKLQGEAREHLAKSAAAYAGASYVGVKIAESLVDWGSEAQDAMSSMQSDPMQLAGFKDDIDPGLYAIQNLPDLAQRWVKTSSVLIDYAKLNGDNIDTSEVEKMATEKLGPLPG
jgi:hypothetical protein